MKKQIRALSSMSGMAVALVLTLAPAGVSRLFDGGDAGPWEVGNQKCFSAAVASGRYVLSINAGSLPVVSTPNGDAAANLSDGLLGADIQIRAKGIAGLVARDAQSGNSSSACVCWFSNDKKFGCYTDL